MSGTAWLAIKERPSADVAATTIGMKAEPLHQCESGHRRNRVSVDTGGNLLAASNAVKTFAETYRVRSSRDACGELVIPGRAGLIYEHGDGTRFGVLLMFDSRRKWSAAKRLLAAAGFVIKQDGDTEGTALFDILNSAQAAVALRIVRVRAIRKVTPAQRQTLADRLQYARLFRKRSEERGVQPPEMARSLKVPDSVVELHACVPQPETVIFINGLQQRSRSEVFC